MNGILAYILAKKYTDKKISSSGVGQNATIAVGITKSVAYGTAPSVTNSGTETDAIFDFNIPEGKPGDKGEKGDTGETGAKGDAFKYSDFTEEQLAKLTGPQGPKGDKGDTGEQGPQGESATAFITVESEVTD